MSDSSEAHQSPATGLCPFTRLAVVLWKTATFWIFPGETCGGSPPTPGSGAATGEAAGNRNTRFSFLPEHQHQQGPGSRALVFPTFSPAAAAHLSAGPVVWQSVATSQCSHYSQAGVTVRKWTLTTASLASHQPPGTQQQFPPGDTLSPHTSNNTTGLLPIDSRYPAIISTISKSCAWYSENIFCSCVTLSRKCRCRFIFKELRTPSRSHQNTFLLQRHCKILNDAYKRAIQILWIDSNVTCTLGTHLYFQIQVGEHCVYRCISLWHCIALAIYLVNCPAILRPL